MRDTELWLTEMVASSARPMVIRSRSSGNSAPGAGPAIMTRRLGRSSSAAARACAVGAPGEVCLASLDATAGAGAVGGHLVLQDDAVVADLNEIAVGEVLRVGDAQAVHEDAVVAREVFEDDRHGGRRAVGGLPFFL